MTIAPDTPTDIARRQRALVTEAWQYAARGRPEGNARTVWELPDPVPGWDQSSACRDVDPEAFVVRRGTAGSRAALRICAGCTVVYDCRVTAVRFDDQFTVRGAMLPGERNRWLREQNIPRPEQVSTASQRPPARRINRRVPLDVARVVHLRQAGSTFPEIGDLLGCAGRTAQRRFVEWERQQTGGTA